MARFFVVFVGAVEKRIKKQNQHHDIEINHNSSDICLLTKIGEYVP